MFSGERLDVDDAKGLQGECDFILSKGPISSTIQAPILSLAEAKKMILRRGWANVLRKWLAPNYLINKKEIRLKRLRNISKKYETIKKR